MLPSKILRAQARLLPKDGNWRGSGWGGKCLDLGENGLNLAQIWFTFAANRHILTRFLLL
jgi:hypothetical protein